MKTPLFQYIVRTCKNLHCPFLGLVFLDQSTVFFFPQSFFTSSSHALFWFTFSGPSTFICCKVWELEQLLFSLAVQRAPYTFVVDVVEEGWMEETATILDLQLVEKVKRHSSTVLTLCSLSRNQFEMIQLIEIGGARSVSGKYLESRTCEELGEWKIKMILFCYF